MEFQTRTLIVGIVGKPNAGKSTLLNTLVQKPIAVATPKIQTTRHIIRGIRTIENTQLIFLDTPGIFEPKNDLEQTITKYAKLTIPSVDLVVVLHDINRKIDQDLVNILRQCIDNECHFVVALNKIDKKSSANTHQEMQQALDDLGSKKHRIFHISALHNQNIDHLLDLMMESAVPSHMLYRKDQSTNLPMEFLLAEVTRGVLFMQLEQELPYCLTVHTESIAMDEHSDSVHVSQVITTDRPGHKKIIIGNKGSKIKSIGIDARVTMEKLLEKRVHLKLFVSVKSWLDDPEKFLIMAQVPER